ncbi:PREDICTED: DNA-(apurinic or apyrimidinic site) lyase isoform X2 [Nicrophorus vespilloides]|nr:PREDICTED: DNA-(apurinic or apyrimidinic site) lyase isoform X2 [Nicrophorus vespilloides]
MEEEVNGDAQKPEPKKPKGRAKKEKVIENDEDTEEVEPKKTKGRAKKQILPEEDDAEENEIVSEPKKTKGRQKKQPVQKIVEDEEKPKKGRGRQKKQTEADVEEDQEMDDVEKSVEKNDVEEKPKKGRGRQKKQKQTDVEDDIEMDGAEIVENDKVEEKPKKGRGRQKKQIQADVEDDQELDQPETVEDDVKVEEKPKKGRGRQKKQKVTEVVGDQEEDEEVEKEKPGTKRGRGKQTNLKEASDSDESAVSKPKRGRKKEDEVEKTKPKPTLMNKTDTDYSNIEFSCTKTSKDGDEANYVVSSWNVDGLRAWLKKSGLTYIQAENADVLCLQETKCSQEKLPEEITTVDGYKKYWASSKKDGYAGVALFSKVMPIDVKYGIGNEDHDEEGRCITAEFKKFFVISVYVPNAGRKLVTLSKRLEWNDLFMKFVQDLDKIKPVIICGDMNVAHSEIDLSNPKTNKRNAGFTQEERDGMSDFLDCGFVDTYRKLYPDKENMYTFWSYMNNARSKNVGWRLDYFLISERLANSVCDNVIRNTIYGSDHCPITLFLNIK